MNRAVFLTNRAEQDRDQAYDWYRDNYSEEFAQRWYNGLQEKLLTLADHPHRCPIARENNLFPFEVREVLYGKQRKNHRVLFTIRAETVAILHIRHTAQLDITEEEL